MKAHEYRLAWEFMKAHRMSLGLGIEDWTHRMCAEFAQQNSMNTTTQILVEMLWNREGRPYYTVYPVIQDMLARVKLNLPGNLVSLPRRGPILVRFIQGQEPICNGEKLRSILAGSLTIRNLNDQVPGSGLGMWADFGQKTAASNGIVVPVRSFIAIPMVAGMTVEEACDQSRLQIENMEGCATNVQALYQAMRYLVAVCLLGEDSELVDPDVLDKDRLKWQETQDPLIVERAHRRGKLGWLVGASIEQVPHLRRPHFGLRWTGEGKKIPKIVPISGSIVHRNKLIEGPQGYLEDANEAT